MQQHEQEGQQALKLSSSGGHAQQLQLQLQQQAVLALDSNGSSGSGAGNRIHVSSRQQHLQQSNAGGSGRLACLSLALPVAQWK